jgi:hypothetical protein
VADWYLVEPPGLVPVPAAAVEEVQDRRVILAEPPGAFRYDMRAVSQPYQESSGEYVDVVSEHDWYRSRLRGEPVPTSRYPLDHVWVEHRRDPAPAAGAGPSAPAGEALVRLTRAPTDPTAGDESTVFDRVVGLDGPPVRRPRRAADVPDLTGRRIVVMQPGGPVPYWRAVSEPYVDRSNGDISVTICSEHDWYRWAITREPPRAEPCPIYLVWVE